MKNENKTYKIALPDIVAMQLMHSAGSNSSKSVERSLAKFQLKPEAEGKLSFYYLNDEQIKAFLFIENFKPEYFNQDKRLNFDAIFTDKYCNMNPDVRQLNSKIEEMATTIENMTTDVGLKSDLCRTMTEKLQESESKIAKLKEQLKKSQEEADHYKNRFNDTNALLQTAKEFKGNSNHSVSDEAYSQLSNDVDELTEFSNQAVAKIKTIEAALDEKTQQLVSLTERVNQAELKQAGLESWRQQAEGWIKEVNASVSKLNGWYNAYHQKQGGLFSVIKSMVV